METYDIFRHMYLRQTFCSIYVVEGGRTVDAHKDYVVGGGWSEHSLFIHSLVTDRPLAKAVPRGPRHSQPRAVRKARSLCEVHSSEVILTYTDA